jgi:hypothetical protein
MILVRAGKCDHEVVCSNNEDVISKEFNAFSAGRIDEERQKENKRKVEVELELEHGECLLHTNEACT